MEIGALRALNSTFVRKGIVAGDSESGALPVEILSLLDALKSECQSVCENARDIASLLQLCKERSLHQTLEALDGAADAVGGAASSIKSSKSYHEKQIQAIEMHEKSGREINDTLQRHRVAATREVHDRINVFACKLAAVLSKLIRPELEEELARAQAIVHRLVSEKQRLNKSQLALEESNRQLVSRIDSLENAPNGGGDAILCNKLRERVRDLSASRNELLASIESMEKEREKHRWDMLQMKKELELRQRTFLLTKAMHEKETKQLVDLVQTRQSQFAHVMQSSGCARSSDPFTGVSGALPSATNAKQKAVRAATPLEVYDPVSGHTIQYANKSPQKSYATSNRAASAAIPFAASPPQSPKRKLADNARPDSPVLRNQHHRDSASRSVDGRDQPLRINNGEEQAPGFILEDASRQQQQTPTNPVSPQSPTGRVRRLVSPVPTAS